MERYAPIHPEHPLLRTAFAVLVSLGVHAALLTALVVWALAVVAAERKAEAARPKEVTLATLDREQWERNRSVAKPEVERRRPPSVPAETIIARGVPGHRPVDGKDERLAPGPSTKGWAAEEGPEVPAPTPGPGAPIPGPTVDLRPRPATPAKPSLDTVFAPSGEGALPDGQGTTFLNLTVAHPEAWRFEVFFNRAVVNMDGVWRYEMGAPMSPALWEDILKRRTNGACSFTGVRIEKGGRVVEARVRRSSGYPDLDEIIAETIRRTSPYVNLPSGLYDANGVYADTWKLCIGLRY